MSETDHDREAMIAAVLDEYASFLKKHDCSWATIKTYKAMVRRMAGQWLDKNRNNEELTVEDILAYEESLAPATARLFRVAWKWFGFFLQDQDLPVPPTSEDEREKGHAKRGDVMGSVAKYLASNIRSKTTLAQLRWSAVNFGHDGVSVTTPDGVCMYYGSRAKTAMRALARWGHGDETPAPGLPLFPVRRGDFETMSPVKLAKLMRESKQAFGSEEDRAMPIPLELVEDLRAALEAGIPVDTLRARIRGEPPPVVEAAETTATPAEQAFSSEKTLDRDGPEEVEPPSHPTLEIPPMPIENMTFKKWMEGRQPKG